MGGGGKGGGGDTWCGAEVARWEGRWGKKVRSKDTRGGGGGVGGRWGWGYLVWGRGSEMGGEMGKKGEK